MATSSIFTHVVIDSDEKAQALLNALERAEKYISHDEPFVPPECINNKDQIIDFF